MKTDQNIKFVSNWGYWFELDDGTSLDGRAIRVRWSDGLNSLARLKVVSGSMTYHDHGHVGEGRDDKLAIVVNVHGSEAEILFDPRRPGGISFEFLD